MGQWIGFWINADGSSWGRRRENQAEVQEVGERRQQSRRKTWWRQDLERASEREKGGEKQEKKEVTCAHARPSKKVVEEAAHRLGLPLERPFSSPHHLPLSGTAGACMYIEFWCAIAALQW